MLWALDCLRTITNAVSAQFLASVIHNTIFFFSLSCSPTLARHLSQRSIHRRRR